MKIKIYLIQEQTTGKFYLQVRNNKNAQTIFVNVGKPFDTKQAAIDYFNDNATDDYELIVED